MIHTRLIETVDGFVVATEFDAESLQQLGLQPGDLLLTRWDGETRLSAMGSRRNGKVVCRGTLGLSDKAFHQVVESLEKQVESTDREVPAEQVLTVARWACAAGAAAAIRSLGGAAPTKKLSAQLEQSAKKMADTVRCLPSPLPTLLNSLVEATVSPAPPPAWTLARPTQSGTYLVASPGGCFALATVGGAPMLEEPGPDWAWWPVPIDPAPAREGGRWSKSSGLPMSDEGRPTDSLELTMRLRRHQEVDRGRRAAAEDIQRQWELAHQGEPTALLYFELIGQDLVRGPSKATFVSLKMHAVLPPGANPQAAVTRPDVGLVVPFNKPTEALRLGAHFALAIYPIPSPTTEF